MSEFVPANRPKIERSQTELRDISVVNAAEEIFSVEPEYYFAACTAEGVIFKITRVGTFTETGKSIDYALRETIAGEHLIFRILKSSGYGAGIYTVDFISERYGYALMEFSHEEIDLLEKTILSFIHNVLTKDKEISTLRFSGAPSSYSKTEIDEARELLRSSQIDSYRDIDSLQPNEIRDLLYRNGLADTAFTNAHNDYGYKRNSVFSYRLKKLFDIHELPYKVQNVDAGSEVWIERVGEK